MLSGLSLNSAFPRWNTYYIYRYINTNPIQNFKQSDRIPQRATVKRKPASGQKVLNKNKNIVTFATIPTLSRRQFVTSDKQSNAQKNDHQWQRDTNVFPSGFNAKAIIRAGVVPGTGLNFIF